MRKRPTRQARELWGVDATKSPWRMDGWNLKPGRHSLFALFAPQSARYAGLLCCHRPPRHYKVTLMSASSSTFTLCHNGSNAIA